MDEFDSIARLFRPLATSPEALGLMDDAALLAARPGYALVVTADALVEGVHFLPDDPADLVARKMLRVNLSDLAAKAAEPYGYMLTVAWSLAWDEDRRTAFARGLGEDQATYGLKLFGGDTVSTPGPMTASVTMFGWVQSGRMIKRSGARAGDVLLVSGTIGDGSLGLSAAQGELDLPAEALAGLANRYRLPQPRTALRHALLRHASAGADVSDGLLADAAHIGEASGLGVEIILDALPLSAPTAGFLNTAHPRDERKTLLGLATGGDDYEIVCTTSPDQVEALRAAASAVGVPLTVIGRMVEGQGVSATFHGEPVHLDALGWRHG
jgi:thiamine-monophosphate kinase